MDSQFLNLGEGNTDVLEKDGILFKCEFQNPTGSVKDRGISFQISHLWKKGIKNVAISSSGNAAISAASYAKLASIELTVFISPSINPKKKSILESLGISIIESNRPVSNCIKFCANTKAYNLRPSTDPYGHVGFESITYELYEKYPEVDAIFIPVSSGTTLKGIYEGCKKKGKMPKLFAIQTQKIHPIAAFFDKNFNAQNYSIVDSIVARYTPRQDEVVTLIKKSKGEGFIISDEEVKKADIYLQKNGINTSYEGALALAGLWKGKLQGLTFQKPICLLTGKKYD